MKINSDLLAKYIKKASINGSIPTMLLDFREDGVVCKIHSIDNICMTNSILKASAFSDYAPGMKLHIKSSSTLLNKIEKLVEGVVELTLVGNVLMITDTKGSSFEDKLASADVIENIVGDEKANGFFSKFDGGATLLKKDVAKISKAIEIMKSTKTWFFVKEKKIAVVSENKIFEKSKIHVDFDYKDYEGGFNSEILKQIFSVMEGDVVLSSMDEKDVPIMLKESHDSYIVRIGVAPVVDTDGN